MLQAIRDRATGWIAWVIVILISIPFALWGIQEYLGVGAEPVAATVNGEEILEREVDLRAREFRESLRASLGAAYRPDLFDETQLRRQVRERMIDERVLLETLTDWGMRAGDDLVQSSILSVPSFQQDGRFNQGLYDRALRSRGMTRTTFEQGVRQDIVLNQVRQAIQNSGIVTQREIAEAARLQQQRRDISYASIAVEEYVTTDPIDEEELQSFYEKMAGRYMVPEKLSVQYLSLDVNELANTVVVDEQKLRSYFEQHDYEFRVPEQRKLRHILISLSQGASEEVAAAALQKVQAARDRLTAGEDFATVAKELSDDPGSAEAGGDLGFVERGVMVARFEEGAFALEPGVVSEPVLSQYGYHLIEVLEIKPGAGAELDEVRDKVEAAYRRTEAENLFYDYVERLGDLTFENPGSLAPAAEELGLDIRTTEAFTRSSPPPALQNPKALDAAFSEDVLVRGNNSDLLELGPDQALVLRLLEHQEAYRKPFVDVRQQVEEAYRLSQADEAARKAADNLLSQLNTDGTLEALAEQNGWQVTKLEGLVRDASDTPRELVDQAFELRLPDASSSTRYGMAKLEDRYAVLRIDRVIDGDLEALSDEERRTVESRVRTIATRGDFDRLLAALRESADIQVGP